MSDVPHRRPPHLHREPTRHGKHVWYVRIGKGPRTRIKRAPTVRFHAARSLQIATTMAALLYDVRRSCLSLRPS